MTKRTVDLFEKVLATTLNLPPYARINEDRYRRMLERIRAGKFSEEVEKSLRNGAKTLLIYLEVTRMLVELEEVGHA
jgi:hypothetical protein